MERRTNQKTILSIAVAVLLVIVVAHVASAVNNQCSDGIDNDLDGKIDYPEDNGCVDGNDNSESLKIGYASGCFVQGEKLMDVFGHVTFECTVSTCSACILMTEAGNWTTLPSHCYDVPACGFNNGNNSGGVIVDQEPPQFNLTSPLNGSIIMDRQALVEFSLDERADVYYLDLINGKGRWARVCTDCAIGNPSYSKPRVFDEGMNLITFKATDVAGNPINQTVQFFIDSKKPKILKAEPKSGYSNGDFYVEFQEDNPKTLMLYYGNDSKEVDIDTDCNASATSNKKYYCNTHADLNSYDGQEIYYWWTLEDIAGNIDNYKMQIIKVDNTAPIINSAGHYSDGRYDYIRLNFTEINPDEITYLDLDDPKGREKSFCRRTDNGICDEKIRLPDGNHDLQIMIYDEAGNVAGTTTNFFTDSKDPKIKKTEPRRGFASGEFYIEFDEANPVNLVLHYGNGIVELTKNVIIDSDCVMDRYYECNTNVDLSIFNGQEIEYWWILDDIVGNIDESKHEELSVDTIEPVLNNPGNYFWYENGTRYAYFNMSITEDNFEEVTYSYIDDRGRIREKRICSRLDSDGMCYKRISFMRGTYNLTINVKDEAGNMIGLPANFIVDY